MSLEIYGVTFELRGARAEEMVEADFVERGGAGVGGDVAADVVLDAIGAHDHGQRVPANQALDAALEFLIAGEQRLEAIGNRVGVRRVRCEWEIDAGNGGVRAEALQNFRGDFGAAGFEERIKRLEPFLHFQVVESVRYRNARPIIGSGAAVYGSPVHQSSFIIHNVRPVPVHSIGLRHGVSRITSKFISIISTIEYTGARKSARVLSGRVDAVLLLNPIDVARSLESGGPSRLPSKLGVNQTAAPQKLQCAAAVDDQDVTGDEGRMDEEGDGVGNVIGSAGAVQGGAADEVGFPIAGIAGHCYCAGRDGVDADFGRKRFGEAFGQHDYAGFRCAVRDVARPWQDAADVRKIDDDAMRLFQQRRGGLRAEKGRFQIGVQRGVPHFLGRVVKVRGKKIGGAIDEDVE